jgi:hypothetical protein
LRFEGGCLLDIECKTRKGESVYPRLAEKEDAPGEPVFNISITCDSDKYEGYDLPGLLRLFKNGAFKGKGAVRMKPPGPGARSGKAPANGTISPRFRWLLANLDALTDVDVASVSLDEHEETWGSH